MPGQAGHDEKKRHDEEIVILNPHFVILNPHFVILNEVKDL